MQRGKMGERLKKKTKHREGIEKTEENISRKERKENERTNDKTNRERERGEQTGRQKGHLENGKKKKKLPRNDRKDTESKSKIF